MTSYVSNYDTTNIIQKAKQLLQTTRDNDLKNIFTDLRTIRALRQPRNLLRQLTNTKFMSEIPTKKCGIFKCSSNSCLICRNNWLQECDSFITSINTIWTVKCMITCNSKIVSYYLICLSCLKETYTGITVDLRARTNQHIHEARTGNGSNKFDRHVFNCMRQNNFTREPFFKMYVYAKFKNIAALLPYEKHFHQLSYDTMN